MEIYTSEMWNKAGAFNATPYQEITAEVYETMYNIVPPLSLPRNKAVYALQTHNIPVHSGFLMGEPNSSDENGLLYHAFGSNNYGKGSKYYYLGLSHIQPVIANGTYYYFDCMNADTSGLYPKKDFKDDAEAIKIGANYEATIMKYKYFNGERISSKTIYDPLFN